MKASETDFKVVFVCTGNICRSPMAEQMLRQEVTKKKLPVTVSSAGVMAMTGDPMTTESANAMANRGFQPEPHVSQDLTADILAEADLVLAMTLDHRSELARIHPRASRYSFTFDEFARLVSYLRENPEFSAEFKKKPKETRGEYLKRAIAEAVLLRGMVPTSEDPRDVTDPYGESIEIYSEVAEHINGMTNVLVDWMDA